MKKISKKMRRGGGGGKALDKPPLGMEEAFKGVSDKGKSGAKYPSVELGHSYGNVKGCCSHPVKVK